MSADPREVLGRSPMSTLQVVVVGLTIAIVRCASSSDNRPSGMAMLAPSGCISGRLINTTSSSGRSGKRKMG